MATITYTITKRGKNGNAEIFVRFSASRTFRQRSTTNLFINPNVWDDKEGRVKNSNKLSNSDTEAKSKLEKLSSYLNDRYISDYKAKKTTTTSLKTWIEQITWIKNSLGNWEIKPMNNESLDYLDMPFSSFFKKFIEQHDIAKTRKKSYYNVLKMWKRYEKWSKNVDVPIRDINKDNLQKFREFFKLEHTFFYVKTGKNDKKTILVKEQYKFIYEGYKQYSLRYFHKERSDNYIQDMLRKIKTAWNYLLKERVNVPDIFDEFEIGTAKYAPPIYITAKQRGAIYKAENLTDELKIQRDIHIFQCYVGCRYGDLIELTYANIIKADNGKKYLHYVPKKTFKAKKEIDPVEVPLHAICLEIIERYRDNQNRGDKLLPFVANQYHNRCLKQIYKAVSECNVMVDKYEKGEIKRVWLPSVVSSQIARRNFIGILKENGASDEDIISMSGHVEGSKAISRYRAISNPLKEKMIDKL